MGRNDKCKTCRYRYVPGGNVTRSGNVFCQYILITGMRRPCVGGNRCKVYLPREETMPYEKTE